MDINLEYIKALASNQEGVDVEFKETTGQLNRGMETLCGMVNGKGGIVIFGVTNKGNIVGQKSNVTFNDHEVKTNSYYIRSSITSTIL